MLVRSKLFSLTFIILIVVTMSVIPEEVSAGTIPMSDMKQQAQNDLKELLGTQEEWVKVHVAEFLIWENHLVDKVRAAFLDEEQKFGNRPRYRIGIWRVLAQAAATSEERSMWVDKIKAVYDDPACTDRLHAIETLAKLKTPVDVSREWVDGITINNIDAFVIYRLWNAAYHPDVGPDIVRTICLSLLAQLNEQGKLDLIPVVSYVLRYLKPFALRDWLQLQQIMETSTTVRANLLATAWITAPFQNHQQVLSIKKQLMSMQEDSLGLPQLLHALGEQGEMGDREILYQLYNQVRNVNNVKYDADIHATAAYAVLKVTSRIDY